MSLPTNNANFDALAPRTPGELITSADWNALVAASKSVQQTLNAMSQAADTRLTALETGVQQIQTGLQAAVARVTTLENTLRQYNRVTLKPAQSIYALGETAIVSATVADLAGQPIAFTAQNRPYVTFVCTWGRLRAVPGFESDPGLGDRTVTVRTNLQGVAQVRLQPDHSDYFDIAFEDDVSTTMTGKVAANNKSAAELIRTANTPGTARDSGAFKFLTVEYDRADTTRMRDYVDRYYQANPDRFSGRGVLHSPQSWQDYRSTVFCFVQNSNDVSAPDFGRAAGSAQVVYRDWISPWYSLDYAFNTADLKKDYRDRLAPKFTLDLDETVKNLKNEVVNIVGDRGALRKQRDYRVIREALEQINLPQAPSFLNRVTESLQNAISMQQVVLGVQNVTGELPAQDVAFEVFTNTATRADASVGNLQKAVDGVIKGIAEAEKNLTTLSKNVVSVGSRLDAALADNGAVGSLRLQLNTIKNQVSAFALLNPTEISARMGSVQDLSQRVFLLETKK
jgi:hypothetical protein